MGDIKTSLSFADVQTFISALEAFQYNFTDLANAPASGYLPAIPSDGELTALFKNTRCLISRKPSDLCDLEPSEPPCSLECRPSCCTIVFAERTKGAHKQRRWQELWWSRQRRGSHHRPASFASVP
jgi:hypothetical protein